MQKCFAQLMATFCLHSQSYSTTQRRRHSKSYSTTQRRHSNSYSTTQRRRHSNSHSTTQRRRHSNSYSTTQRRRHSNSYCRTEKKSHYVAFTCVCMCYTVKPLYMTQYPTHLQGPVSGGSSQILRGQNSSGIHSP